MLLPPSPPTLLQDRYAGLTGPGSYRGGLRGAPRGGFRGGFRGGPRGGFRGGFAGGAGGRDFNNQDIYADYNGPESSGGLGGFAGGGGAFGAGGGGGGGGYGGGFEPEPSQQIMVRNVGIPSLSKA